MKSAAIHDTIIDYIKSLKPVVIEITMDDYFSNDLTKSINGDTLTVYKITDNGKYWDSMVYISSHDISYIADDCTFVDSIGSFIYGDGLVLNTESYFPAHLTECEDGFCNVYGLVSISEDGVVRYSQIDYSFKYKRIIIRNDVRYQLPFKPDLKHDFGGHIPFFCRGHYLYLRLSDNFSQPIPSRFRYFDKTNDAFSSYIMLNHTGEHVSIFENEKRKLEERVRKIIDEYSDFTKIVSPSYWRRTGNHIATLKKIANEFSDIKEITPIEQERYEEWLKESNS